MKLSAKWLPVLVTLLVAAFATVQVPAGQSATPPCGSFTVSAELVVSGPYTGLYKYTITGSWDTGGIMDLTNFDIDLGVPAECCEVLNLIQFDSPAGTSTGTDSLLNDCTAEYVGTFDCVQNSIKFDASDDPAQCEPEASGSGTWCFYTSLEPLPNDDYFGAVTIKSAMNTCSADISGALPDFTGCTTVPTEQRSWGEIKSDYGK